MVDVGKTQRCEGFRSQNRVITMTQRTRVKLFCAAACLMIAVLCVLNRAPILAAVNGVAVIVVLCVRFGREVESADIDAFISRLKEASRDGENHCEMVRATVWPRVISAPILPPPKRQFTLTTIVYRDELSASHWRALATRLRHQSRAALWPDANR